MAFIVFDIIHFSSSSMSKANAMDNELYQRMSSTDMYDEIPEVKEEYDLAPDFQRILIAGQEISGVSKTHYFYVPLS
jgi:hypothetical protein